MTLIKNVTFIQHGKLTNVVGRIRYISDEKKQENLYAVYETVPRKYWRDLAKENQSDFRRSGTSGNCIEARELIIALPKEMTRYDPDELLRYFVESYRKDPTEKSMAQSASQLSTIIKERLIITSI